MTLSVVALAVVVAVAVVAVTIASRRVHHEMEPTIAAFQSFRAAIAPAAKDLRDEVSTTQLRIIGLRDPERTGSAH